MHSVYLVEDESAVRNAIRDRIDWAREGFTFIGEAPDGEVALREICELQPDLVITDIRMPFMDGLTLSTRLKTLFPRIRIVILTGHDDFEYAREALRCGVNDYLLKPLSAAMLQEALSKVRRQMDDEQRVIDQLQTLREETSRTFEVRRGWFLRSLCEGLFPDDQDPAAQAVLFNLDPPADSGVVILIKPRYPADTIPGSSVDCNPVRKQLRNYLDWLSADAPGYFHVEFSMELSAMIIRNPDRTVLEEQAFLLATAMKAYINRHFSLAVTVAIGKSVSGHAELHTSYTEAASLLASSVHQDRVLFRDEGCDNRHATIVARCRQLITERYADPDLSLPAVANEVAVSPGRLSTMFHQETGEKFIAFLNRFRLEQSVVLLCSTDLPVSVIAERCGYNQAHYFSSLFKRHYGASPLAYRHSGTATID